MIYILQMLNSENINYEDFYLEYQHSFTGFLE